MSSADQVPLAAAPASLVSAIEVRGPATPEQLAALVAVLSAAGGSAPVTPEAQASGWADRQRAVRQMPTPGRGAWRAATQPR